MELYTITLTEDRMRINFSATFITSTECMITLHEVIYNSFGTREGFSIGDRLISINEQPVTGMSISDITSALYRVEQPLVLTLSRGFNQNELHHRNTSPRASSSTLQMIQSDENMDQNTPPQMESVANTTKSSSSMSCCSEISDADDQEDKGTSHQIEDSSASTSKDEDIVDIWDQEIRHPVREKLIRGRLSLLEDSETREVMDVVASYTPSPEPEVDSRDIDTSSVAEISKLEEVRFELPKLESWMEKKGHSVPYSWSKRWVMVRGSYIMWSNTRKEMNDSLNDKGRKQKNQFRHVKLRRITQIFPVQEGKKKRKWVIKVDTVNGIQKLYWRCESQYDRDYWVESLQLHLEHARKMEM